MIKKQVIEILSELVPDNGPDDIKNKLVIVGSSSLLSLQFITIIEEVFDIEIDDDDITYKLFVDVDHLENVIKKYKDVQLSF